MTNSLAGLKIGHASNREHHTGCTVLLCPEGTIGGVDVRGTAPASRELILLASDKLVSTINAVLLTGGSAFGLSAAEGVMRYLAERNIGHPTPIKPVPIVCAASAYDLFFSRGRVVPDADMGYRACEAASEINSIQGNVGAGTGVTVGKWGGYGSFMKGGFGLATFTEEELEIGAAAVVNSIGDVVNDDGSVLAGARSVEGEWLVSQNPFRRFPDLPPANLAMNTTLVVAATNARLDKVRANILAQRAHDGLAMAVRPVHTSHDGDIAFGLSTGQIEVSFDYIGNIAVTMVAEAIRNAVRHATTVSGIPGLASENNDGVELNG